MKLLPMPTLTILLYTKKSVDIFGDVQVSFRPMVQKKQQQKTTTTTTTTTNQPTKQTKQKQQQTN
jgi:hypothetical protein